MDPGLNPTGPIEASLVLPDFESYITDQGLTPDEALPYYQQVEHDKVPQFEKHRVLWADPKKVALSGVKAAEQVAGEGDLRQFLRPSGGFQYGGHLSELDLDRDEMIKVAGTWKKMPYRHFTIFLTHELRSKRFLRAEPYVLLSWDFARKLLKVEFFKKMPPGADVVELSPANHQIYQDMVFGLR